MSADLAQFKGKQDEVGSLPEEYTLLVAALPGLPERSAVAQRVCEESTVVYLGMDLWKDLVLPSIVSRSCVSCYLDR